ncbi:hypothetical protein DH2020_028707 [Rehmannia glutinosa]|uniref:UBX domain-containing protein n=1 Tax=Rehmannia glutinosa TaxID=99300 RepID=A0ABR0VQL5_REHGL
MVRPDQEAIDTFMSITGVSEAAAIQRLEETHGNLNEAVNAYFSEGDRNIAREASFAASQDDIMDVDDPIPVESDRPPSLRPFARDLSPFSLLDPNFTRSISDIGTDIASRPPFVSHPREVREIPVEVKDGTGASGQSGSAPVIEDVTETAHNHDSEIRGTVILDGDDDDLNIPNAPITRIDGHGSRGGSVQSGPSAPTIVDVPDNSNDIEEEMIRAAIEASKHDTAMSSQQYDHLDLGDPTPQPVHSHLEDTELAHAVSLSLQTADKEKALRELEGKVGDPELEAQKSASPQEMGKLASSSSRKSQLEIGSSSIQDETDDVEELELVRHRRRRVTSSSIDTPNDIGGVEMQKVNKVPYLMKKCIEIFALYYFKWGGISSVEHDEAVMLEAAMFGGIPEGTGYHFPYAPHQLTQNGLDRAVGSYSTRIPRPPSPSLTAQRLIREQQDDEYLAALQADREKELKAKEEAEAALAEERRREDEFRRQQLEEQEIERQLAAKEASLPQEPTPDDENAVTLLVRMPDGSRRGRRFRKSDNLQYLFDFIDVGRGVKPGSYRLVRPFPRRAFGDGESSSTLSELGLTSKQEALYLELI